MKSKLTILYTANLAGDIHLLPRLYTFLARLKQEAEGQVLLVDAGNACTNAVWHCDVTGGRSMLLVLDAMGYDAANASNYLSAAGQAKLAENYLNIAALAAGETWSRQGVVVTTDDAATEPHELHIVLAPGDKTSLTGRTLRLAAVNAGQAGVVQIGSANGNGRLAILNYRVDDVPPTALPDPTIAATVDFVLSEARYYRKRRDGDTPMN